MPSTEQIIYSTAKADGMPDQLALLIVAQSKHETGDYTSNLFKKYNNAFGYSYVSGAKYQLPTPGTIADNGKPIAAYANVQDSTHEITAWIKRRQKDGKFPKDLATITTATQYAQLLKNAGYYGASLTEYLNGLIRFYKANIKPIALGTGIIIIAAIAFFLLTNEQSS
jgi:uncharacterized FlgJ-related protein